RVEPTLPSGEGSSVSAAPPEAVALVVAGEISLVVLPSLVLLELDFLHGGVGALALVGGLLHLGGKLLHEAEQVLDVLLGAEPAGMAGDQPFPIHRHYFFERILPLD